MRGEGNAELQCAKQFHILFKLFTNSNSHGIFDSPNDRKLTKPKGDSYSTIGWITSTKSLLHDKVKECWPQLWDYWFCGEWLSNLINIRCQGYMYSMCYILQTRLFVLYRIIVMYSFYYSTCMQGFPYQHLQCSFK